MKNYKLFECKSRKEYDAYKPESGWRKAEDWEVLKLCHEEEEVMKIAVDSWLFCDQKSRAVSFNYLNSLFHIDGYGYIDYDDGRSRGVLIRK